MTSQETHSPPSQHDYRDLSKMMTPAHLAVTASRGRWGMSPHLAIVNRKLLDLSARKTKRLMIALPPRCGKSEMCSLFFPSWYLGMFPDHRIILTAYESDFAAGWGAKVRDVLNAHGRELFGITVSKASAARDRWDIDGREGGMVSTGVGGAITGRGANLAIIDDPIKNAEDALSETLRDKVHDWYQSTLKTRLEPDGVQLLIMTRWHQDDLAGRLMLEMESGGDRWTTLNLPAIAEEDEVIDGEPFRKKGEALWPERYPIEELEKIKAGQKPYWWSCLYQQKPTAPEGAEFPPEYFGPHVYFDEWPENMPRRYIAIDPSKGKAKGDYSAIVMMGVTSDNHFYVDADLERRPCDQIVTDGLAWLSRFGPVDYFGCEANAFQDLLGDRFLEKGPPELQRSMALITHTSVESKAYRILKLDGPLSRHRIHFKSNSRGAAILVQQLRDFPYAQHDDGPDALAMCFELLDYHAAQLQQQDDMQRAPSRVYA